jgi:hypothetical protein
LICYWPSGDDGGLPDKLIEPIAEHRHVDEAEKGAIPVNFGRAAHLVTAVLDSDVRHFLQSRDSGFAICAARGQSGRFCALSHRCHRSPEF